MFIVLVCRRVCKEVLTLKGEIGMADKKIPKAVKRWRRDRNIRRLERDFKELWSILKGKNIREKTTIFTEDEKKKYFFKKDAIGTITCPLCGKVTFVANPNGIHGDALYDYIMRHNAKKTLCSASLMPVKNFFDD
ncbi:MAG: hypothetical protein KBC41_01900 [Candidatus Pacebacteria bacterium]|nr:hypothetical protein [Candidatus Paceibacterota bacterium]